MNESLISCRTLVFPHIENSVLEPEDFWYGLRWQILCRAKHENMLVSVQKISSFIWHSPSISFYEINLHWKNCHMYSLHEMPLVHISVSVGDYRLRGSNPTYRLFVSHYLLVSAVLKHKHSFSFLLQWWQDFCNSSTGCLIKKQSTTLWRRLFICRFVHVQISTPEV
jgi:hypothetical protein